MCPRPIDYSHISMKLIGYSISGLEFLVSYWIGNVMLCCIAVCATDQNRQWQKKASVEHEPITELNLKALVNEKYGVC